MGQRDTHLAFTLATAFPAEDQQVIMLGAQDPVGSLGSAAQWFDRLINWVAGPTHNHGLANPRLETLRRTVLILRSGRPLTETERDTFGEHGFSEAQLQLLQRQFLMMGKAREMSDAPVPA